MGRCLLFLILVSVALVPVQARAQAAPPRRGKWWQAEDVQRELSLTPAQVNAIEKVFQHKRQERITLRQNLDALQMQLNEMLERADLDDAHAEQLIERVETARVKRNTARTRVLLRMYRVLTPDQRVKLATVMPTAVP
jgi:Spy/CpxP family protein refolding chaperone